MREGMRERDRGGSPDASGPPPFRGPSYKTKLCALWRGRGGCPRPNCGFAHGEAELRRPPPRASFQPRPRPGRRDYRDHEFRLRPERRHSPRYSPEREIRRRSFRDKRPSSEDRGSSRSRSPIRKSERKHSKSPDGGKTDSSISYRSSDNEDRGKDERYLSSDEKNGREEQLKQMHLDMEALREDKSKLEAILEKKTDEERKLCSRVEDLELQLNKDKEDCQRMISKTKKLIKAHGRYIKAQEDLKRSQARFERLADLLASDILKPCTKEQGSIGITANEDPYNANEMNPSDQRQNHVSASRKRPISLPTSEEAKTGKRQRENDEDMVPTSENYRPEDALEHVQDSKATDLPESFTVKKLREGDYVDVGNIVSSSNIFADRYKGDDEEVDVD
ncbi:zinc finger CCCH domain-containing protein 13-like isoform X1 [Miscanthus floridulus]|uniref:zinc finger CCCH domain-containing protein 13-like isoform X1 n=1 Tax=Miscanthus floridulus TaxID=154761 RepID=UPI00345B0D72